MKTKRAILYIGKILFGRGLGLLFYALGARWIVDWRAWVYFLFYILATVISSAIMLAVNPETLAERNKAVTDSPRWDKVLLTIYWLLAFFAIYLVAGLESGKSPELSILFWLGILLSLFATIIALAALMVNTYLESTARIQTDRDQKVISTGIYRIVRHPTYSSVVVWSVAISLVFPTPFVWLVAAVIAGVIIVRTYLEDRMLLEQLSGYREYTRKTRWRLIPFVW